MNVALVDGMPTPSLAGRAKRVRSWSPGGGRPVRAGRRTDSLHDSVVIHSTSGSDIHDGRAEVVFFYSVYCFFSGDWRHNTSEYS